MRTAILIVACVVLSGCGFFKGVKQSDTVAYTTKPEWFCSYVCYVHGEADSMGCRIVTASNERAARKQFHEEVFGETCRITAVEKVKVVNDTRTPKP